MAGKIGIIGFGNMGSAIAERIKNKFEVTVFDKDASKTMNISGMNVAGSAGELVNNTGTIILAVKPQDFDGVLNEIKEGGRGKLVISIAAGITSAYIEKVLNFSRVVRVMPNIGAKIGSSVTCLSKGKSANDDDLHFARELFQFIGKTQDLDETMMNAATAISGSGPGYYFNAVALRKNGFIENRKKFHDDFIVELKDAAEGIGFDSETALFLANWTVVYSDLLLKQSQLSAEELRRQVTSKGGTTEAALEVLRMGGSLVDAVKAAVKRAQELSK
ncbi:MAG: pyrroline-5-carboxylate reductase [Candidatus Omnitrophica bacterium]|nr:pyrroline-5-carboxylate reductase [Candidatus Omnitrophota bacterium]